MDAILRRLIRAAMRRGMAGDWVWLLLALSAFLLRRALRSRDDLVTSITLTPGERVLITVRGHDERPAPAGADEGASSDGVLAAIDAR
ncbi:MAG TPA: hypothetical protein VL961_11075 [Acidimicrobiales bacterium]|nr:hypothetical protein [Acidimicrobiales bacterium]